MSEAPGSVKRWVLAARPRTLPAAIVPVAIGATLARPLSIEWVNTVLCAVVALSLQIGVNYANDYSDGIKGTDEVRVGPFRLTASKLVPAKAVRNGAFAWFFVAALAGLELSARTSWWFVLVGLTAIIAAWFYTGGPKPYGYMGLGEVFVLVYFGFVATVGTAYAQHLHIAPKAWWFGLAAGAMACALLEANNMRDITGDQGSGKKTLAARLGRDKAKWLYVLCMAMIFDGLALGGQWFTAVLALVVYYPAMRLAFSTKQGRELLPMLMISARAQLIVGFVTTVTFFTTLR